MINSKKKTQNKDEMSPPAVFKKNNKNIENNKDLKFDEKELSKFYWKTWKFKYLFISFFSDIEEMNALTFMVVGETGCIKLHYLIVLLMLY